MYQEFPVSTDSKVPGVPFKPSNKTKVAVASCAIMFNDLKHVLTMAVCFMLCFRLPCFLQVNDLDNVGQTPLHRSAQNGHVAICELLLENGADASICSLQGYTAAQIGTDAAKKLLQGFISHSFEIVFII